VHVCACVRACLIVLGCPAGSFMTSTSAFHKKNLSAVDQLDNHRAVPHDCTCGRHHEHRISLLIYYNATTEGLYKI